MGATLDLHSRADRGSMFYITAARALPATLTAERAGGSGDAATQAGLRVLVVDNEPEVLEATLGLLRRWGHHPRIAANGAQALALLQTESFDLALVDHQLDAGENGIELIADWRARGCAPPALVMVSADRNESFLKAAAAARLPVLHKPVKPAALRALLASLVR
jgi:CheY-like chemotaxis protein